MISNKKATVELAEAKRRFDERIWTFRDGVQKHLSDLTASQVKVLLAQCRKHGNRTAFGLGNAWESVLRQEQDKRSKKGAKGW